MSLATATVPALETVPGLVHGFERFQGTAWRETREQSRTRVGDALARHGSLHLLRQVHGVGIAEAPFEGFPVADAATAHLPGVLVGVETADCLPALLVDPVRGAVAAVHAGWRGTAQCVAGRAVAALAAAGSSPGDLIAALGPCIGPCCYEVGEELRPEFGELAAAVFRPGPRGRPHLDLREANLRQLRAAGLRAQNIHQVAECTCCLPGRYHSFRRDGPGAGRMISFVGFAL
jgi:YfiH family protein